MEPSPVRPPTPPARGLKRLMYVVLGIACVGLAYLGVLLPGLPTTPFLLMASYCFVRSSPRLHRWLHRSPLFGRFLRDWETHRGIRRPIKVFAVGMIITVVSISIIFGGLPIWLRCVIGGLAAIGITTILLVPTIREP